MVLVLQTITKEDFNRGYTIKGDLNGSYQDVTDYLSWVLNSKRTDGQEHLKKAIEVITKRFMPYVTTKYLRNFVESKNASERLHYLLKGSGYTTEPVKQYLREQRCVISQSNHMVFNGTNYVGEKINHMGRLSRVFVGRTLQKVITQKEFDELQQRFREKNNKILLEKDFKDAVEKYRIAHECNLEVTARQEKAIKKLLADGKFLNLNCKECNHQIRLPLTPNLEVDQNEMLAFGIYQVVANDIEAGNYLCYLCQAKKEKMLNENNRFDYSAILNQLEQMKNSIIGDKRCFSIPTLSFMMEFYKDIGLPSLEKVNKILNKAGEQLNCEFLITPENIKIRFN